MHLPPLFFARTRTLRRTIVCAAVAGIVLSGGARSAFAQDEPDLLDAVHANYERWGAEKLGALELPLGLRAHFNTNYTWHFSRADRLSSRFVGDAGPELSKERFLDSRFALSRTVSDHVEFEIAWGTRNHLTPSNPLGFRRQTIGALIRITP